nr:enoyl-CoA hydratase-related protein [Azospirillum sp. B510]
MSEERAPVVLSVADGIADIQFNRPEALNAINVAAARAFRDAVELAASDGSVRVILLSGAGRAFVAGGDLTYFRDAGADASKAATQLIEPMHAAILRLRSAPQPVVACLQGAVAGAGMSVALAADLAVAADDVAFNMAYVRVAATPDCSASWTLPRLLGMRKAMEVALLADTIRADEALRLGLVNRIVPRAELDSETRNLARRLADSAPLAVQGIKRLLTASLDTSLAAQLDAEGASFVRAAGTRDFHEALAAFFEKRAPRFVGQ